MTRISNSLPSRQVRAAFTTATVRVYQAYSPAIADKAVTAQRFVPPFSRDRMTWIKPSFTWMMYRCGWGEKQGQERILAIDMLRTGFESALAQACLSHYDKSLHTSSEAWRLALKQSPVRVQWDPERDVYLQPLDHRAVQIGLEGDAIRAYVDEWAQTITDITDFAKTVRRCLQMEGADAACALLPKEEPYPLPSEIARHIGCT
ncbi:MAG: DUF4291 domain-containing protein [Polyangiaceae bacterium]|nr:DUF4291 domain-containing protein [Polyangiaceae bacterium]